MCCGVICILFGWFLRVPSLHALAFFWKTFCDFVVLLGSYTAYIHICLALETVIYKARSYTPVAVHLPSYYNRRCSASDM